MIIFPTGLVWKVSSGIGVDLTTVGFEMAQRWSMMAFVFLMSFVSGSIAHAACSSDTLSDVSENGEILQMISGEIYQVDPGDAVDSRLWLAAEDVLICGTSNVKIINTEENSEKVEAIQLH